MITPFDIPLLNNEICQYLTHQDLACCVQVSKAWAAWFAPTLWRDLDCQKSLPDAYTLARQQEHVKIVRNIAMKSVEPVLAQLPCMNLQRLDFMENENYLDIRPVQLQVLPVLEKIPTLRHLQITLALDSDSACRQWIRVLEAHPHLESLSLKSVQFVDGMVFQKILQLCSGYERLSFCLTRKETITEGLRANEPNTQEINEQGYRDAKTAIERMPEMRVRELSFHSYLELCQDTILYPLLERCPRMEKLDLFWVDRVSTLQHLSMASKEQKLPKLRHLVMGGLYTVNFLEDLIKAVSCIKSMESLQFHHGLLKTAAFSQCLVQYHHHSLTRLDFGRAVLTLWMFSEAMAGLPNLRYAKAKAYVEKEDGTDVVPLDKPWKSLDLRCLLLTLETWSFGLVLGGMQWAASTQKQSLDYLFPEIAKMKNLQQLKLGCDQKDLYLLKSGYLTQLADLKQMRVFDLATTPRKRFGKQEGSWMAKNWPRLVRVYSRGASAYFRRGILEKRPHVEILE
ncbi:hypothetical protein BGX34_002576 [Mortierella sp. NVP85]|nr:hypothetical protein BGX34_002576 [Mortierella sp. NVP85]